MRYWSYLSAKMGAVAALAYGLLRLVDSQFPPTILLHFRRAPDAVRVPIFMHDMGYTFSVFCIGLFAAGLMYVAIWDQRQRCRTCLRKLILPRLSGSWGNMLRIGRPKTEWICRFGHGTLHIDELQFTGKHTPDWERHDDNIWKELEFYDKAAK